MWKKQISNFYYVNKTSRGTQFLNNSKCPCCKKQDRVSKPYGHIY